MEFKQFSQCEHDTILNDRHKNQKIFLSKWQNIEQRLLVPMAVTKTRHETMPFVHLYRFCPFKDPVDYAMLMHEYKGHIWKQVNDTLTKCAQMNIYFSDIKGAQN